MDPASISGLMGFVLEDCNVPVGMHSYTPNDLCQPNEVMTDNIRSRPVGTRGGCGEGRGPGACPRRNTILLGSVQIPLGDVDPDEDKHQAPSSTQPLPLSLQDAGALLLPDSVGKIH